MKYFNFSLKSESKNDDMKTLSSSSSTTTSSSSSYISSERKFPHPKINSRTSETSKLNRCKISNANVSQKLSDSSGSVSSSYMESPRRNKCSDIFSIGNESPKRFGSFTRSYSPGRKKANLPAFISTVRPSSSSSSLASSSTSTSYLASPTLKRSQSCNNSPQAPANTSSPSSRQHWVIKQNNPSSRRESEKKRINNR